MKKTIEYPDALHPRICFLAASQGKSPAKFISDLIVEHCPDIPQSSLNIQQTDPKQLSLLDGQ